MNRTFNVHLQIRKGLGPEWVDRIRPVTFEPPQTEMPDSTLCSVARTRVEQDLYSNPDFKEYGKNWQILKVREIRA